MLGLVDNLWGLWLLYTATSMPFAGIAVVGLPLVALYVWLGRRIIEGMTLGSGK